MGKRDLAQRDGGLVPRIRARLTYANVTATLALVVALGGGSFAVAALSGKEKRVVKKIAKKEANKRITSRAPALAVRHARSAGSATTAGTATSATHAGSADDAVNADQLDGLDSSALERSGELVYGVANPIIPSAEYFTIPEMGLRVETDPDEGTGDNEVTLRNISASRTVEVMQPGGSGSIAPGDTQTLTAPIPADSAQQIEVFVQDTTAGDPAAPQQRLYLHCYFWAGGKLIRDDCIGIRLTP